MKKTMQQMLDELRPAAARSLWTKSREASRVAKAATSLAARRACYAMKTAGVSRAVVLSPNKIYVGDLTLARVGIAGLGLAPLGQLHVPVRDLDPTARAIIAKKLTSMIQRHQQLLSASRAANSALSLDASIVLAKKLAAVA